MKAKTTQVGRKVRRLAPPLSPEERERRRLARKLERESKLSDELRRTQAELAESKAALARAERHETYADIASDAAESAGIRDARGVADVREAVLSAAHKAERKGLAFDPYREARQAVADVRERRGERVVRPSPVDSREARAGQLPPSAPDAHTPLSATDADRARRDEQARAARERGEQVAEQVKRDADAYREALRRLGLEDPTTGNRGPNPGGYGY